MKPHKSKYANKQGNKQTHKQRCANRIAKGKFSLNNQTYELATNNGNNHLHGGNKGFDKVLWKSQIIDTSVFVLFSMFCGNVCFFL